LKYFARYQYYSYFNIAYALLVALSYFLSIKYFAFTELFFRFCFVYSTGIAISRSIPPYILPHGNLASLILAIFGIFFKFLTYKRISILCSVYTFTFMICYGFDCFLRSMINDRWFRHGPLYFEIFEIAQIIIFLYASYKQLKSTHGNQHLVDGNQNYSTFRNSSDSVFLAPFN
jgi:hypothetical protein